MKRAKSVEALGGRRRRLCHLLLAVAALYLVFISAKLRRFLEIGAALSGDHSFSGLDRPIVIREDNSHSLLDTAALERSSNPLIPRTPVQPFKPRYGRIPGEILRNNTGSDGGGDLSQLEKIAHEAWSLGLKAWDELERSVSLAEVDADVATAVDRKLESCPSSVSMEGGEPAGPDGERLMFLPCGLAAGSSVTVVGTPQEAHAEYVPQLARLRGGDGTVMVCQFMVELQGLKAVDGEDPPKILHLNPRVRGDWSRRPVIEHNTCYRMQWGKAMRCDGLPSMDDDDTVDEFVKCEKWQRSDIVDFKDSKTTSWLRRFVGRAKKPEMTWPFPFVEGRLFVVTIQAGVEGYHIYVGGRHITSFAYRTGFPLEDATGLAVKGNIEVHSAYATSLPTSHPSFSHQQVLEMSEKWKSAPMPGRPVYLFIGILSATNHFAERMAIRKTWMQYPEIKSSNAVARFFVALNPRKEVNAMLKKEAEFFGDIVILPFMDSYELVVLKTIAICEYGVHNLNSAYIMKGDDDTFIRLDFVLREIKASAQGKPLYMGNLNLLHRPLRSGKWAVTFEEWPEEVYPPYANGPGYIISKDIARYIVSKHANQSLRLFKMEDVSMGMWVEQYNMTSAVQYSHSWRFCQYGCLENYYTAHYQSPRQMICLWDKLARGRPNCCNFR